MKKITTFLILFCGFIQVNYAQLDKPIGVIDLSKDNDTYQIITSEKDTILCTNLKRTMFEGNSTLKYKTLDGASEKIKIAEVDSYYKGQDLYIKKMPQRVMKAGNVTFMRVLETGKVNLYEHTYVESGAPMMGADGMFMGSLNTEQTDYYLQKGDGKTILVRSNKFHKVMSAYFEDNPSLEEDIRKKRLRKRDIRTIVTIYNR